MPTADIYGFKHEDMESACSAIESALSIRLQEAQEIDSSGCYFRVEIPAGPTAQLRRNSGSFQPWQGDPSHPWYPDFALLVFVHGPAPESIAEALRHSVPGLIYFESKETTC